MWTERTSLLGLLGDRERLTGRDSEPDHRKGNDSTMVKSAPDELRLDFVRKVYGILTAQLLLSFAIAVPIVVSAQDKDVDEWALSNAWMPSIAFSVILGMACVLCCCQSLLRIFPTNYIFILIFTVAEGLAVGYSSALLTWQSVLLALGITIGIFFAMTILAWTTSVDFTGYGPYLYGAVVASLILLVLILIASLCGIETDIFIILCDFLCVLLFTFYIVYDTQLILGAHGGHKHQFSVDDYCFASLSLYLDVVLLFTSLIELLGQRR